MMKVIYMILVFSSASVHCQDAVGEPCDHEGAAGVCRPFMECAHAQNLVMTKRKPTDCFFDDDGVRVVCCVGPVAPTVAPRVASKIQPTAPPTAPPTSPPTSPPTPAPTDPSYREFVNYNSLRFEDKECRYNGTMPIRCCSEVDFTDLPISEPAGCPKLAKPRSRNGPALLPHEMVILDACYEYSRVGSQCLRNVDQPNRYIRDPCISLLTSPKVSGGDPAMPQEFPHMAVLGCMNKTNPQEYVWYGGGSLISEFFILTAAHATYHKDHGSLKFALMGTINKTDIRSGVLYSIRDILRYPNYNATTKKNDIALLKLDRRVSFSDFIRPACLRIPGLQIMAERRIAGWGYMGSRETDSEVLLKATIYELPHSECVKHLHRKYFVWDNSSMVCAGAGGLQRNPDSCEGDSGGPLMTHLKNLPCSYVVVGIVSWGPRCGVGLPGSYTNASKPEYLQWIVGHVWPRQLRKRKATPL